MDLSRRSIRSLPFSRLNCRRSRKGCDFLKRISHESRFTRQSNGNVSDSTRRRVLLVADFLERWEDKFCPRMVCKRSRHDCTVLFEIQLPYSNRLVIPAELAAEYFPRLKGESFQERLQLTDNQNSNWYLLMIYYPEEHVFVSRIGWDEFVNHHKLETSDVVRFCKPGMSSNPHHFYVECERKGEKIAANSNVIPEFKSENFLFQLELFPNGDEHGPLIPKEQLENHFSGILIPPTTFKEEIVRFTDSLNKDWYMGPNIIYYDDFDSWDCYVKEHDLKAMDVVKFYKPVHPLHAKHFLIDHVKREANEVNKLHWVAENKVIGTLSSL